MKTGGSSNGKPGMHLGVLVPSPLARIKPYKARSPERSVSKIRTRLSRLGVSFIGEPIHGEEGSFSYCLQLVGDVRDEAVFQTMGKGRTNAYAKASAYGEMVERIQNLAFYMMLMYPSEPETNCSPRDGAFKYCPDEKALLCEELHRGIGRLSRNYPFPYDFLKAQSAIGVPFWNVFDEKAEYLPFRAFQVIVGSNGMCSGNTPAEALIHGICEVFERYVLKQFFLSPSSPPDVPLDLFKGHGIHDDLSCLAKNKGYNVCVKDCSLGFRLPVVGLLIRDGYGRYAFHLGSDPSPITALERCLTEMCQGGQILFKDTSELEGISGDIHVSEFWRTQLHLNIRSYEGHWPLAVLLRKPDYPFRGFDHPVSQSDEHDLKYVFGIIKDAGWDLLIRDHSFLGLPSYHVYIPGLSEMANAVSDSFVRHYLAFDRQLHALMNPFGATPVQREKAVQAMEQYAMVAPTRQFCAAEYFMYFPQHPLAAMSHKTLKAFLLQPVTLSRAFDVPACFECETCWCTSCCSYPFISTIWNRLKQTMTSSAWAQSNLRYITKDNVADAGHGTGEKQII